MFNSIIGPNFIVHKKVTQVKKQQFYKTILNFQFFSDAYYINDYNKCNNCNSSWITSFDLCFITIFRNINEFPYLILCVIFLMQRWYFDFGHVVIDNRLCRDESKFNIWLSPLVCFRVFQLFPLYILLYIVSITNYQPQPVAVILHKRHAIKYRCNTRLALLRATHIRSINK